MHQSSLTRMQSFATEYVDCRRGQPLRILDIGSYDVNGTYRQVLDDPAWEYVGIDAVTGPGVDVTVQQTYRWPELRHDSFDLAVSGQAFEHIQFPWVTILEVARVLRPGGLLFLVVPSSGPEHRFPMDCWRYYPDGLVALAQWADLDVVEAKTYWENEGWSDDSDDWHDSVLVAKKRIDARLRVTTKRMLLRVSMQFQASRRERKLSHLR